MSDAIKLKNGSCIKIIKSKELHRATNKIPILDFVQEYLGLELTAIQKGYLQLMDFAYKNKPYIIPLTRGQATSYDTLYAMVRSLYDEW